MNPFCRVLNLVVASILIAASLSSTAWAEPDQNRMRKATEAVPVQKVIEQKPGQPTVLRDKQGRVIVIQDGTFRLPTETAQEIAARGKKRKGGGTVPPTAPKPSNCTQVGSCTESNWTEQCNDGGTKECRQWVCLCASRGGSNYKSGRAVCSKCTKSGGGTPGGGGIGDIPETQMPGQ